MSVRLFLEKRNDSKSNRHTLIIGVYRAGQKMKVRTSTRFKESEWSQKQQRVRPKVDGAEAMNASLAQLRADVEALTLAHPDFRDLREAVKNRLGKGEATAEQQAEPDVLQLYAEFRAEKAGEVKKSTLQVYNALGEHLGGYVDGKKVMPDQISAAWLRAFRVYLQDKGLQNATMNKLVTRMRGFCTWLEHERGVIERAPKVKPLETPKSFVIHLDEDELQALVNVDLSEHQNGYTWARDRFAFAAVTGQRYVDIDRMEWTDIRGDVWYLRVQKTNTIMRVPLPTPALEILERYRDEPKPLPRLSNQKSNDYLKEVCKLAGIDSVVTVHKQSGGEVVTERVPKWTVISTHAARRTFVTLALAAGVPQKDLVGYTHADLKSLAKYAAPDEQRRGTQLRAVFSGFKTAGVR